MESTRKGLRSGDLYKDTYERLTCADCDDRLTKRDDPDEIFAVRACSDCGAEWKEIR